jgi:aldehyde dehydrogenase (NAD+)
MSDLHQNFIAGEWITGAGVTRNINPSNTNDVVGEYAQADSAQAATAIAAAKAAATRWARSTPQERYDVLKKISDEILARKEELGGLLAREEGKTLPEGIGEVTRAAQIFAFFSGAALPLLGDKLASVRPGVEVEITREAVHVVGIIAVEFLPSRSPPGKLHRTLLRQCGSVQTRRPCAGLGPCFGGYYFTLRSAQGRFQLSDGRGSIVGEAFLNTRNVNAITFTGSVATGKKVAAACVARMAKFQLEMGGKNPLVVLDDADLKVAVECAVNGAFFSTGQRCTASSRLIVTSGIHDAFVAGP